MSADEEDDGSADDVCAFINAAVMEVYTTPCPILQVLQLARYD